EAFVHGQAGLVVVAVDGQEGQRLGRLADVGVLVELQQREQVAEGTRCEQLVVVVVLEAHRKLVPAEPLDGVLGEPFQVPLGYEGVQCQARHVGGLLVPVCQLCQRGRHRFTHERSPPPRVTGARAALFRGGARSSMWMPGALSRGLRPRDYASPTPDGKEECLAAQGRPRRFGGVCGTIRLATIESSATSAREPSRRRSVRAPCSQDSTTPMTSVKPPSARRMRTVTRFPTSSGLMRWTNRPDRCMERAPRLCFEYPPTPY